MDPGALGGLCGCPCPQGLEVRQCPETPPHRPNPQHRPVQAVLGADLGTGTKGISRVSAHSAPPPTDEHLEDPPRCLHRFTGSHAETAQKTQRETNTFTEIGSLRHKSTVSHYTKKCDLRHLHKSTQDLSMRISHKVPGVTIIRQNNSSI